MSIASDIHDSSSPRANESSQSTTRRTHYVLPRGAVVNSTYEIDSALGHGGMGEVYKAWHPYLSKYFAIKILLPRIAAKNPALANSFMQEARLAIRIKHPNFIEVFDANYDSRLNIYFIIMELVEGDNLRKQLKTKGVFSEMRALEIALYVGRALEKADEEHIVHRDIKPDNIMLTKDGKVKLADLGIAKSDAEAMHSSNDEEKPFKQIIGTPAYASPEQIEDAQNVDCRADIYSLGVTLYEMLSGKKPYVGGSAGEIVMNMYNSPVPNVRDERPEISIKTARLIQKAMSKERDKRPENWTVFCKMVENILGVVKANDIQQTIDEDTHISWPDLPMVARRTSAQDMVAWLKSHESIIRKTAKKSVLYILLAVVLCCVCLAIKSAASMCSRDLKLLFVDKEIADKCDEYKLDLPLELVWAAKTLQMNWVNMQLKDDGVKPVAPEKGEIEPNAPSAEPKVGKIRFVLDAPESVQKFLAEKGCRLQVETEVSGMQYVAMPDELEFPLGTHTMHFSLPFCKDLEQKKVVVAKEWRELFIVARLLPGTIYVECNIPGSRVVIDGQSFGEGVDISVDALQNHELKVDASGYVSHIETISVEPKERRRMKIDLQKVVKLASQNWDKELRELTDADSSYKNRKYSKAEERYRELSKKGNVVAMFKLGEMLEKNIGGIHFFADPKTAFTYYLQAAEKQYVPAVYKVAEYYECALDEKSKALKWYRHGADYGDSGCIKSMGRFYEEGLGGVKKDTDKAISYYKQVAEATKDRESQLKLAELYEKKASDARTQAERGRLQQEAEKWRVLADGH